MGYTHYFRIANDAPKELPAETLNRVTYEIKNAYDAGVIQFECADNDWIEKGKKASGPPEVTPSYIRFNGIGDLGHETFIFALKEVKGYKFYRTSEGERFDFCKTARKPYDFVVTVVLCLLKDGLGDKLRVSSDGQLNDDPDHEFVQTWTTTKHGPVKIEMTDPGAEAAVANIMQNILAQWSGSDDEWNGTRDYMRRKYGIDISFSEEGELVTSRIPSLVP